MFHNMKLSMFHNKNTNHDYKNTLRSMYISAYVFLLQVQVEAVVTVSAKYGVTYIT